MSSLLTYTIISLLVCITLTTQLKPSSKYKFPFLDPSLSWDTRVDDLISRLTTDEVIAQSLTGYHRPAPAVPRLGVKPFIWISECLRGMTDTNATQWPAILAIAATFSTDVVFNMSQATSIEARGHFNDPKRLLKANYGINCFSPVVNLNRHPLWGRNQETYGEDPFMVGLMGGLNVKGKQGDHPRYKRTSATCKHLGAYAGPESYPVDRHHFDARVLPRDLWMSFLPTFEGCVSAGASSVMCSLNAVNGIPSCVSSFLLTEILRKKLGFRHFVVTDDESLRDVIKTHRYINNSVDCAVAAVRAGCNLELADAPVFTSLYEAVRRGKISDAELRANIRPVLLTRFRLGEFDPVGMNPYHNISPAVVHSEEHRQLAYRAAMMSFVLLKNDDKTLPLSVTYKHVAIIGPFANDSTSMYGDYRTLVVPEFATTPWQGLKTLGSKATLVTGCNDTVCAIYNSTDVRSTAKISDLIIICIGTGYKNESEAHDRRTLALPGNQQQLLEDAASTNPNAKIIVLVFTAGPVDLSWAKDHASVSAILQVFYPGETTGRALYSVLTARDGAESIPAGRLPSTWPAYLSQVPPITDYGMLGHTYRYYRGDPMYPFGYGLSYSSFYYTNLVNPSTVIAGTNFTVSVVLTNLGPFVADEVVQVYVSWLNISYPVPKIQLVGFRRVTVPMDSPIQVNITVVPKVMCVWLNENTGYTVLPGAMSLFVGGQQPNQKTSAPSNVLQSYFTVRPA